MLNINLRLWQLIFKEKILLPLTMIQQNYPVYPGNYIMKFLNVIQGYSGMLNPSY